MAFDGIVTNAIVKELRDLINGKIDKIYEPDKNTIILGIYSKGKNYALTICIDARNSRINLTTHTRINPQTAPNFCMLLRKHLIGGRIANFTMTGLERLVKIDIETLNEFNEIEIKTLIVELMGKHSNIILVNKENKIIDAMRHTDKNNNSYRDILPSHIYTLPKSEKQEFTQIKEYEEFYQKIYNSEDLAKAISDSYTGFSLSFVKNSIKECEIKNNSKEEIEKLYKYINEIINGDKLIFKNINEKDYYLVIGEDKNIFQLNYYIDDFYFEKEGKETFKNYRNSILKIILEQLKKYSNRLVNINSKLNECENMDEYKLYGELITANLYHITNNHTDSIELENYYDNNKKIIIPLDKRYSPNINAKNYFKKYTKLKNGLKIISQQKTETEQELKYIESIIYELEDSSNIEEVEAIFEEISENIIFKERLSKKEKKKKTVKNKKKIKYEPIKYEIDGFNIFIGRNNKENDWLTFIYANKNDIWFHAKDIQGSHLILKNENKPINEEILIKCAKLAAMHSKAKNSSNVPVDYCQVQFVKKPKGSKPGMVIFTNNKTLNVNPQ